MVRVLGNRWCYLVLALKSLGIMPALGRAGGTGTGHMLSHPCELQVAKEVKLVQLNPGLQLQVPSG